MKFTEILDQIDNLATQGAAPHQFKAYVSRMREQAEALDMASEKVEGDIQAALEEIRALRAELAKSKSSSENDTKRELEMLLALVQGSARAGVLAQRMGCVLAVAEMILDKLTKAGQVIGVGRREGNLLYDVVWSIRPDGTRRL